MENTNSHWLTGDYRIEGLYHIISGLVNSIDSLKIRTEENEWCDRLCFLEDSEPVFGLAFIAFQNYINSTIKDFYGTTDYKTGYYRLDSNLGDFQKSRIELIVGLANYSKYKENQELHSEIKIILDCFGLNSFDTIDQSPIFKGINLLDKDWDLFAVLNIVKGWRKILLEDYIENFL